VETLVGTAGAVDDGAGDELGVGFGVGVGIGVGVGVEEELGTGARVDEDTGDVDEELGSGTGFDEDTGGTTPLHVPNAL
jgi:hypothetical protein